MHALNIGFGLIFATAIGCSSTTPDSGNNTPDSSSTVPTLAITSPAAGAMVTPDAANSIPVAFTVTNFTLAAPGPLVAGTGHIHVLVDGNACTPDGAPYDNADTTASPAIALLGTCPAVKGAHTITLELHDNAHGPVKDASGTLISAQVAITAL